MEEQITAKTSRPTQHLSQVRSPLHGGLPSVRRELNPGARIQNTLISIHLARPVTNAHVCWRHEHRSQVKTNVHSKKAVNDRDDFDMSCGAWFLPYK